MTSLVFAAYVAGLVPVLLVLAGASDRLGRLPVLFFALICSLAATLLMIFTPSMAHLFLARILQGIGVGLGMGTVTAYLSEQRPGAERAISSHVAFASSLGFGGGALATSASLMLTNNSTPTSYYVAAALLVASMTGLLFAPASQRDSNSLLTRLPHFLSGSTAAYLGIAAAWSVSGLVIAILPVQLALQGLTAWGGPALFLVNMVGVACQPLAKRYSASLNITLGAFLIPTGYLIMVHGATSSNVVMLLFGASLAGAACYGFTYLGGLTFIVERAGKNKASAVSGYFLFAYLGFSLPNILLGLTADKAGIATALQASSVAIILVHLIVLFLLLPRKRYHSARQ